MATPAELLKILESLFSPATGKHGMEIVTIEGIGGYKCFKTEHRTLAHYFFATVMQYPANEFLVFGNERLTYQEFSKRALVVAQQLQSVYHIKKGDRIAVAMRNYPEWCITFFATILIGAVVVPLNGWWREKELEYALKNSGSTLLVADIERWKRAKAPCKMLGISTIVCRALSQRDTLIQAGAALFEDILSTESLLSVDKVLEVNKHVEADDLCLLMYTSGTTGNPKGVMLTHRGVIQQLVMVEVATSLKEILVPESKAIPMSTVCPVPLFHVTACHHIFLTCFIKGGKLVLMTKWNPTRALEIIQNERITQWGGVPTMVIDLVEHPNFKKYDTSSLVTVGGGGAPTPPSQVEKVCSSFKNAVPTQGYGLTETNGAVCYTSAEAYIAKPKSTGAPFPICDVLIVNPETYEVLPVGDEGELAVKSPLVMKGYWNNPEATKKALVTIPGHGPGWFLSGDVARMDAENSVYIVDRVKDLIIRGGENISCTQVETAIYTHPAVMECIIVGLPDYRLGEVVGLMVKPKPSHDITPSDIVNFLKGKIASFKVPSVEHILITKETLPRGATGKVHKRKAKAILLAKLKAKSRL